MRRMGINESRKKLVALMVLMMLGSFLSEVRYVLGFIFMGRRILGGVLCRVYVFLCVSMGI